MKIGGNFPGFDISAEGLSIQRKRMNLIAENIANADVTRTADGQPYKRKFLVVSQKQNAFTNNLVQASSLRLETSDEAHISNIANVEVAPTGDAANLTSKETVDQKPGEVVYMPDNPNADANGYVQESNVNIVTEMVDMISATRSYEANLTALNSSKEMIKDSLGI